MRPPLSVTGTRWTRWTPLSNLSLANTPVPGDVGDDFLEPADVVGVDADRLDPPALLGGEALVHAEQVGREQRRLVAAGAGADFEHRRARVGAVARQHGDGELALGLGQLVAQAGELLLGQRAHFGVGVVERRRARRARRASPRTSRGGPGDRLELGIVAAGGDELRRPRACPERSRASSSAKRWRSGAGGRRRCSSLRCHDPDSFDRPQRPSAQATFARRRSMSRSSRTSIVDIERRRLNDARRSIF